MSLHNCIDCGWECVGYCSVRRDKDDNMKPAYDEPTDCPMFIAMPAEEDI